MLYLAVPKIPQFGLGPSPRYDKCLSTPDLLVGSCWSLPPVGPSTHDYELAAVGAYLRLGPSTPDYELRPSTPDLRLASVGAYLRCGCAKQSDYLQEEYLNP